MKAIGVDIFLHCQELPVTRKNPLPEKIGNFALKVVSNRGTKVWPGKKPDIFCVDVYRCRFVKGEWAEVSQNEIIDLMKAISDLGFEWVHVEKLHEINGVRGFSVIQGE